MMPRYYCPNGSLAPRHLPRSIGMLRLVPGKGPDVASGGPGGGAIHGGAYVENEEGWSLTDAGWWLHAGDCLPQDLVRMDTPARISRWTVIQGATAGELWRIPVLIEPDPEAILDGKAQLYRSALDRIWNGVSFEAPGELIALCERLLRLSMRVGLAERAAGSGRRELDSQDAIELAIAILSQGHAVSRYELAARRWLSEAVILRAILAAGDVPLSARVAGDA